jgi:hypothetical protein
LKRKRVPHPLYSPGSAIADLYLFDVLKKTAGIDAGDDEELKTEILTPFQGIPSHELKKSFDHWSERGLWVTVNARTYHPSWP